MIKKLPVVFIAVLSLFVLASCSSSGAGNLQQDSVVFQESSDASANITGQQGPTASNDFSPGIVVENNTVYVSDSVSKSAEYKTTEDLVSASEFIFAGTCVSSTAFFQNDNLYTVSEVEVSKVYRGDLSKGSVVSVVEIGGRTTYGEYVQNCSIVKKDFESSEDLIPDSYNYVCGIDGYFPMNIGADVLLFTGDASGFLAGYEKPLYSAYGEYDGKLYKNGEGSYMKPNPSNKDEISFDNDTQQIMVTDGELDKMVLEKAPA